ncbi:MAG: hypothetical protein IIA61_11975 [Candidatus Marinimicrobia bacterium]|nr:hypothetical protein [Candidatus Neomarinimicrobiota bacterium]
MLRRIIFFLQITSIMMAKEIVPENIIPGEVIVKLAPETPLIREKTIATRVSAVDAVLQSVSARSVEPMFRTQRQRRRDLPDISRIYRVIYDADVSPSFVARRLGNTSSGSLCRA